MTVEFARPERLDTIGTVERRVTVVADAAERTALAARFVLVAVDALTGDFALRREAAGIAVRGRVTASVVQACTVTGSPLPATLDEPVDLRFVEPGTAAEEIELDAGAIDTIELEGGAIDLGEVAAETMALALDPFPRAPDAAAALREAGVLEEGQVGPFAGLAALKDKLERD